MSKNTLEVKGSTIRSKLLFARERFGAEAEKKLVDYLAAHRVPQVLDGTWYPFDLYDGVLVRLAESCYGGDLKRLAEVGHDSAKQALTGTYEIYAQMDFPYFLTRIGALHKRFYSSGDIVATLDEGGGSCRIRMFGAPFYKDADLHVANGFYIGAAEVLGLRGVRSDFEHVDAEVHFRVSWRGAAEASTAEKTANAA